MKLFDLPLVFVDVETTGATARDDRVIELGMIRVEHGREVDRFETLLDPLGYVPAITTYITGITDDDIQHAPQFEAIVPRLLDILDGAIFVAHNSSFDYSFMKGEFARQHNDFTPPQLCTVKLSRQLFPAFTKHSLDALIERHELTVPNRHRAMDDAAAIWQFYQLLLHEFDLDTLEGAMMKQLRRQGVR